MTNDKFKLLENDTIEVFGRTLYRIESLKDFADVKRGDKGGYVEKSKNIEVSGNAWVSGNADINSPLTLVAISPIGSENGTLTAFKNKQGGVSITRGCFKGTLDEFEKAVESTHGDNDYGKTYKIAIELIKSRLEV